MLKGTVAAICPCSLFIRSKMIEKAANAQFSNLESQDGA